MVDFQPTLPRQPVLVIDQGQAAGRCITPFPQNKIEIINSRTGRKALDQQSLIACGREPSSEGLCFRFPSLSHLITPSRVSERCDIDPLCLQGLVITAVKNALDIRNIGHDRCRLQAADLIGLRNAAMIEWE